MYNKNVRNRVDKTDLKESEKRQDEKIRAVQHRVDGIEKHLEDDIKELRATTNEILRILIKQR